MAGKTTGTGLLSHMFPTPQECFHPNYRTKILNCKAWNPPAKNFCRSKNFCKLFTRRVKLSAFFSDYQSKACLKNGNTPKGRPFCRHILPVFLAIHPGFLRQTGFIWQQNFSPLVIFPFSNSA
jgi:hypothetical protein